MIKSYKVKQINKNPELHNEEFVTKADCMELLQQFVDTAVKAGADLDELMSGVE